LDKTLRTKEEGVERIIFDQGRKKWGEGGEGSRALVNTAIQLAAEELLASPLSFCIGI